MDRRQSALIRIVAWSIAAVALTAILLLGLTGHINWLQIGFGSGYYYSDSGKYRAGGSKIDGDDVKDLDINWLAGSIKIEVYDGGTVQFFEKSARGLKEKDQLHYYNKNGKLMIQYQKAQRKLFTFGKSLNKDLTVKIPEKTAKALGYVNVDTISSDTSISGLTATKINLDSTSGDFKVEKCRVSKLDMDSTSGDLTGKSVFVEDMLDTDTTSGSIDVKGSFGGIDSDTVSGGIEIESEVCPDKVRTDGVSGSVVLVIPENEGFTYSSDSVSGSVRCDFEVVQRNNGGTYKDGGASFRFDSVSGSVSIKKL